MSSELEKGRILGALFPAVAPQWLGSLRRPVLNCGLAGFRDQAEPPKALRVATMDANGRK